MNVAARSTPAVPRMRAGAWLGLLVLVAATAIAGINAWRYTAQAANPVVTDDAWYFLDAFVSRQLDGSLRWQDFFVKRDAADHAQPVHKVWLYANTRWFALDFRLDALVAFGGLVLCVGWFVAVGLGARRGGRLRLQHGLLLAALPLLLFSLNSHEIYEWPLVMQYFLVLPFALLLFTLAAREPARLPAGVFLAALGSLVALDGGGLLACIAASLGALLRAAGRRDWGPSLRVVAAIVAAVVVYRLFWTLGMPPLPAAPAGGALDALRAVLADPAALWKLAAIPLTTGWAHWDMLVWLRGTPALAQTTVVIVGALGVVLHALFWWSAWRHARSSLASAFAVMLMLYAYGMWAGIVLGRVPVHGADYLWQHRYIAFFQLANVALLLQWLVAACAREATRRDAADVRGLRTALPLAVVLPMLGGLAWLQVALSERTWERAPYVRAHWMRMSDVVGCIAKHPGDDASFCPHQIPACGWGPVVRDRLVGVLRTNQLNVFAPRLQSRYGFRPDEAPSDACRSAP